MPTRRKTTAQRSRTANQTRARAPKTAIKTAKPSATAERSAAGKGSGVDDRYFADQTPDKRVLLVRLRALVLKAVPDATVAIRWGVPFYETDGRKVCALASFKEHVGINFFAPPEALADPRQRLEGEGKGNRMLKVRTAADIDAESIVRWLKAAVAAGR